MHSCLPGSSALMQPVLLPHAQSGYAWRDDGKPSAPPPPAPNGCSLKDRLLHADFARELRSTERTAEACVLLVRGYGSVRILVCVSNYYYVHTKRGGGGWQGPS